MHKKRYQLCHQDPGCHREHCGQNERGQLTSLVTLLPSTLPSADILLSTDMKAGIIHHYHKFINRIGEKHTLPARAPRYRFNSCTSLERTL